MKFTFVFILAIPSALALPSTLPGSDGLPSTLPGSDGTTPTPQWVTAHIASICRDILPDITPTEGRTSYGCHDGETYKHGHYDHVKRTGTHQVTFPPKMVHGKPKVPYISYDTTHPEETTLSVRSISYS